MRRNNGTENAYADISDMPHKRPHFTMPSPVYRYLSRIAADRDTSIHHIITEALECWLSREHGTDYAAIIAGSPTTRGTGRRDATNTYRCTKAHKRLLRAVADAKGATTSDVLHDLVEAHEHQLTASVDVDLPSSTEAPQQKKPRGRPSTKALRQFNHRIPATALAQFEEAFADLPESSKLTKGDLLELMISTAKEFLKEKPTKVSPI